MKLPQMTMAIGLLALASAVSPLASGVWAGQPSEAFRPAFDMARVPEGFIPPPLHPEGVRLETRQLGAGVYALVSNRAAVDNSGFIVGERGVLVIDAHINAAMAQQIQEAVAEVAEKPILYLVNTNHHGDHTFGNYAFPAETRIIAHEKTAARMRHFDGERAFMLATVNGDRGVFGAARLRLPDITFADHMSIDLGGRTVEIHHFGAGNTPGDTVVYEPETRTVWTGNLVIGEGTVPPVFEGNGRSYLRTITQFRGSLDINTVIPGHGRITDGATLDRYMTYLGAILDAVENAKQANATLEETLAALPIEAFHPLPQEIRDSEVGRFVAGLHRLNIQQIYLNGADG